MTLMPAFGPMRTFHYVAFDVAIGVKRTWLFALHMSAFDPKRHWLAGLAFPSAGADCYYRCLSLGSEHEAT